MSKANLNAAFVVRGWPLADFPSGIITYVNTLIDSFTPEVRSSILAYHTLRNINDKRLIDLSTVPCNRSLLTMVKDAFIYRINNAYTESLRYEATYSQVAKRIAQSFHQLEEYPDIVEIEESFGTPRWLVDACKIPVVVRLHGPWFVAGNTIKLEQSVEYQCRVKNEGLAIKHAQGLTTPSLYVLNRVREFYNLELPHAQVIPNPVPEVPENMRWQGLKVNSKSILFVGRFDLTKGGDLMLDAFRLIALKNPEVELTFVGPDREVIRSHVNYTIKGYIEKFIPESHIKTRIKILGHCNAEKIAELRKNSLVTVIPSRHETFCISLLEALAAGCPAIAAKSAAIEIITDGENGLLAESESAESLAEKVLLLIEDSALMKRLSTNALTECAQKYKPELIAETTANYYRTLLNLT